ncbi:peptidyl-prolyl cis-trans isomerase FKBP7 [Chanos chanos]|uniref:peptidylprolyl isomerase n=1 Tax=Chanos chanos TaxID=29144 RepID=A0A6J2WGQ2_CHACN|nr:peptidyl-prolyl cis-trans isomerase FKBP7 [Chanos chanos]
MSVLFLIYAFFCLQTHTVLIEFAVASEPNEEVKIEVLYMPENCTKKSKRGDLLNAHYDGYLAKDGSQFYCSRKTKSGHPHWFVLGVGEVIKGLDLGLDNMCPGERRKITVPPSLAFGEKGKDPVPPNATVVFEVELLHLTRGPRSIEAFKEIDRDNDKTLTKEEVKEFLRWEAKRLDTKKDESYFDDVVKDVFRRNDHDGDGTLSLKEYNVLGHDEL